MTSDPAPSAGNLSPKQSRPPASPVLPGTDTADSLTVSHRAPCDASRPNDTSSPKPEPVAALSGVDDFGLPIRKRPPKSRTSSIDGASVAGDEGELEATVEGEGGKVVFRRRRSGSLRVRGGSRTRSYDGGGETEEDRSSDILAKGDVREGEGRGREEAIRARLRSTSRAADTRSASRSEGFVSAQASRQGSVAPASRRNSPSASRRSSRIRSPARDPVEGKKKDEGSEGHGSPERTRDSRSSTLAQMIEADPSAKRASGGVSEWSHQALAPRPDSMSAPKEEDAWQAMPALGQYDVYNDDGKLVARGAAESDDEGTKGGAKKGYTRVQDDDDARSATSMDESTSYLFKERGTGTDLVEDEEQRDQLAQMQATKDLLTEGQRIAYVGVTRLAMVQMLQTLEVMEKREGLSKDAKKTLAATVEAMKKWGQKMMVRLYGHMEINSSEQVMIEQLAEHGVQPADLTPALMQNSRVKNPMADQDSSVSQTSTKSDLSRTSTVTETADDAPPPYSAEPHADLPEVRNPDQLPASRSIDLDLRWTVLCDLFLVLIADSAYDARSRVLLEQVGAALDVPWVDICRFEKRVTDALEMQEAAERENWDEGGHIENRRKMALRKRYVVMGLATVGGSLVIGLSAGLLAPVIGAGLAAGFTTIGVAGTGGFLAGTGGAALITGIGVTTGGTIAVRASRRRMGSVRTFEYRPLHNNKRVNLIVSVSGWMTSNVDDVRLPFSTVDPVMGDIYSILWEPEMLCSMGDTIRILATEALTQGLQHVLGATILTALMASLTLPIALTKLSYLLDNPWNVSLDRAESAGLILADSIIDRNLGVRPITLVGFSLGAKLIFSCLKELSRKGALGLVQNVYIFGAPVVARKDDYLRARAAVAGRFVNGFARNDWILGYLFRATSGGIGRVAGLAGVDNIPGIENFDVTEHVPGHMVYREAMPRLLREVGWEVTSDDFAEIEDPDPDNHQARQRELIRELDEARKEADGKKGRAFGLFKRSRLAQRKGWETYDTDPDAVKDGAAANGEKREKTGIKNDRVLFDVDAIRRELESEHLEVKQLESTLPPMQLDLKPKPTEDNPGPASAQQAKSEPSAQAAFAAMRQIKSANATNFPLAVKPEIHAESSNGDVVSEQEAAATSLAAPAEDPRSAPLPSAALAWQDATKPSTTPPPLAVRPELRTATTMPLAERSAWAGEEELEDEMGPEWGKEEEGEVVMSFE